MRILIFSAHPDDAEFAMGGTLLQLAKQHTITHIVMTDGGSGSYGSVEIRRKEQEAAAKQIGAELLWGGIADCQLEYTRAQAIAVAQLIRNAKPDVIFAPHWDQQGGMFDGRAHPDHRALGLLVRDAARFARFRIAALTGEKHETKQVLWYMVPSHRQPKIAIPLTNLDEFRKLLHAHQSQTQLKHGAIEEHLLAVRRAAAQTLAGVDYAEVFDADDPVAITVATLWHD